MESQELVGNPRLDDFDKYPVSFDWGLKFEEPLVHVDRGIIWELDIFWKTPILINIYKAYHCWYVVIQGGLSWIDKIGW